MTPHELRETITNLRHDLEVALEELDAMKGVAETVREALASGAFACSCPSIEPGDESAKCWHCELDQAIQELDASKE